MKILTFSRCLLILCGFLLSNKLFAEQYQALIITWHQGEQLDHLVYQDQSLKFTVISNAIFKTTLNKTTHAVTPSKLLSSFSKLILPATLIGQNQLDLIKWLKAHPNVKNVELNQPVKLLPVAEKSLTRSNTYDANLLKSSHATNNADEDWIAHGEVIKLNNLWAHNTDCTNSLIAVIDTGVDYNHPDLRDNLWQNPNEIANDGIDNDNNGYIDDVFGINLMARPDSAALDAFDDNGHGSHVAGIIAANNSQESDIYGICQKAKVLAIKALDKDGIGSIENIIKALEYALLMNANIINLSLSFNDESEAFNHLIVEAGKRNVLVTVAAGNSGKNLQKSNVYPASLAKKYPNVIAVASSDSQFNILSTSNYGDNTVDIAMPGEEIKSTWLNNTYMKLSGTSMATPIVSGLAAHYWQLNPNARVKEVKAFLLTIADKLNEQEKSKVRAGAIMDSELVATQVVQPQLLTIEKQAEKVVFNHYGITQTSSLWFTPYSDEEQSSIEFSLEGDSLYADHITPKHGYYVVKTDTTNDSIPMQVSVKPPIVEISEFQSTQNGVAIHWQVPKVGEQLTVKRKGLYGWFSLDEVNISEGVFLDTDDLSDLTVVEYKLVNSYHYIDQDSGKVATEHSSDSRIVPLLGYLTSNRWQFDGDIYIAKEQPINISLDNSFSESIEFSILAGQLPLGISLEDGGKLTGQTSDIGWHNVIVKATVAGVSNWSAQLPLSIRVSDKSAWFIEQDNVAIKLTPRLDDTDGNISPIVGVVETALQQYTIMLDETGTYNQANIIELTIPKLNQYDKVILTYQLSESSPNESIEIISAEQVLSFTLSKTSNLNFSLSSQLITQSPPQVKSSDGAGGGLGYLTLMLLLCFSQRKIYKHGLNNSLFRIF
jgi:subtilisin family serine protease